MLKQQQQQDRWMMRKVFHNGTMLTYGTYGCKNALRVLRSIRHLMTIKDCWFMLVHHVSRFNDRAGRRDRVSAE